MIKIKIKNKKSLQEDFDPVKRNYGLVIGKTKDGSRPVIMMIDIDAIKFKFTTDIKYSDLYKKYVGEKMPIANAQGIIEWNAKSESPRRYPEEPELASEKAYQNYKKTAECPSFIIAGIELIENSKRCSTDQYKVMTISKSARVDGADQKGIGETLYKFALAYAAINDSYIAPDRFAVSPGAERNWKFIFHNAASLGVEVKKINPDTECYRKSQPAESPLNHLYKNNTYGVSEFNNKLQLGSSAIAQFINGDASSVFADSFEKIFSREYSKRTYD